MALSGSAAVTIDLWSTLVLDFIHEDPAKDRRKLRTARASAALSEFGERVDEDDLFQMFTSLSVEITDGHDRGIDQSHVRWIERGLAKLEADLPARIGSNGVRAVAIAVDRAFMDHTPVLPDGTIELLDRLSDRGLKLGLISNTGLTSDDCFREWFANLGLMARFDHLAFSNELAVAKPNGEIFDRTLTALGVAADRALHVGDNLHADVGGANSFGMSTVWVNGNTDLEAATKLRPDYSIATFLDLGPIVGQWLDTLDG